MSFSDTPAAVTSELARQLRTYPSVVAADCLDATDTPSGRPEIDCIIKATRRGTLPNAVTRAVVQSSLGLAEVSPANAPDHLVVIVR